MKMPLKKLFVIIFLSIFIIAAWNSHQELPNAEYITKAERGELVGFDNISIGDNKEKVIEIHGEPKEEGYWNGGPFIAYEDVMAIYNENNEIIVLATKGFEQTFSNIEKKLGIPDRNYYSNYEASYMLEYTTGNYILEFFGEERQNEKDVFMVWLREQWE